MKSSTPVRCSQLLAFLICCCSLFAAAQDTPNSAPVILNDKTIITLHWGYANSTPEVRAAGIASRLKALSNDPGIPLQLTQEPSGPIINIRCGNVIIASVFEGDARAENTTKEALAQQWSNSFLAFLQADRIEFGGRRIAVRVMLALLAIAACIWLSILIRRYRDRTSTVLERKVNSTQSGIGRLVPGRFIRTLVMRVSTVMRLVLLVLAFAVAIHTLLGILPQTRPLAVDIYRGTERPLRSFLHTVWLDLPSILFIVILAITTRYVIKLVHYFFRKVGEGAISLDGFRPAWSTVTERLISFAIIVLAVLIAYPYIPGSDSPAFRSLVQSPSRRANVRNCGAVL